MIFIKIRVFFVKYFKDCMQSDTYQSFFIQYDTAVPPIYSYMGF